jgi:hypothetical protein
MDNVDVAVRWAVAVHDRQVVVLAQVVPVASLIAERERAVLQIAIRITLAVVVPVDHIRHRWDHNHGRSKNIYKT